MKRLVLLSVVVIVVLSIAWAFSNPESVEIGGVEVKWKRYDLERDAAYAYDARRGGNAGDWTYPADASLDDHLIARWPEKHKGKFETPFNVLAVQKNVASACRIPAEDHVNRGVDRFFTDIIERIDAFSEVRADVRFVVTRFPYSHHDIKLVPPWTSALNTGMTVSALAVIHECADMPGALDRAAEMVGALATIQTTASEMPDLWVSFRDKDGFLWFEEYPNNVRQTHVLNGHLGTIFGLFTYWQVTEDETARKLIEAGLATMEHYVPAYRVPGEINDYDLNDGYFPDYGPLRTILQQKALFDISGEKKFLEYSTMFREDMGDIVD